MSESHTSQPINSCGNIDDCIYLKNSTLDVQGWAASSGYGMLESVEVTVLNISQWLTAVCAGKDAGSGLLAAPLLEQHLHLPSPDVAQVMAQVDDAGNARFELKISTQGLDIAENDVMVTITPYFSGGRRGKELNALANPSLPLPTSEDLVTIGSSLQTGFEFLAHFIRKAGLQADARVLDVGCGVGRMAYALTYYLGKSGSYEGFDILKNLIDWAQGSITPHFPNFHFQQVPIYNKFYHPEGTVQTIDFKFPYADDEFDFVFLTSVFTHMEAPEVRHYLEQIRRVLKPGGRCLCTCFLLNEETDALHAADRCNRSFNHPHGEAMVNNPDMPEAAIAFPQSTFLSWAEERGFKVGGVFGGNWCGREKHLSYQDIVLLELPA